MSYQNADIAKEKFVEMYLGKHGMHGVGIGKEKADMASEGEYVVRVFAEGDKPNIGLPDQIDGVKIVYEWNCGKPIAFGNEQ